MNIYHQKLVTEAPKLTYARHAGTAGKILISGTDRAKEIAISHGVTRFDALSFYRFGLDDKPHSYLIGDFSFTISFMDDVDAKSIGGVARTIQGVLADAISLHNPSFIFARFAGGNSIELTIPSCFFRLEMGAIYLHEYYTLLFDAIKAACVRRRGVAGVLYDGGQLAENVFLSEEQFAVPIKWDELSSCSLCGLRQIAQMPRSIPSAVSRAKISPEVHFRLLSAAIQKAGERELRSASHRPQWLPLTPLFDANGASSADSGPCRPAIPE